MINFLDFGTQVIVFIQNLGGWLLAPMELFSLLGNETFYLLVVSELYWCVSTEIGLRLGGILMLSGGINDMLKVAFHAPRPYWYSAEVKALAAGGTFGIPSGHAQHAVLVWGILADWMKRRWVWVIALFFIFCISFSRLYLGVHFPTDILAGWLIGSLLVWIYIHCERKLTIWFLHQSVYIQCFMALLVSLGIIGIGGATRLVLGNWQMPPLWLTNAARANNHSPTPLDLTGVTTNAGVFFGMVAGSIWLRQSGGYAACKGKVWQMVTRYCLGIMGIFILWIGLGNIFPKGANILSYSLQYLRYSLIGVWFTGVGPLIFIRLGLAERN